MVASAASLGGESFIEMQLDLSPPFTFPVLGKHHLPDLNATSRFAISSGDSVLLLFQVRQKLQQRIALCRSFNLEASIKSDNFSRSGNWGSLFQRNEASVIHGVSETIVGVLGRGQ